MVTHDPAIARQADRIVRLVDGRIEERWDERITPSAQSSSRIMSLKIYINGKLYDKEDAKVSVYDHGLLYGDGVFEGIRSYGGKVFRLDEHLDRLWDSAKAIWLEIPITKQEMAKAIEDTLAVNDITGRLHPRGRHPRRAARWGSTPTGAAIPR